MVVLGSVEDMKNNRDTLTPENILGGGSVIGYNVVQDHMSPGMVPYFIHFSDKGFVPEITRFSEGVVETEEVLGERLGELLGMIDSKGPLEDIYNELGVRVGYMFGNFPVNHNDLHVDNIVVSHEDDLPYIIDWETASYGIAVGDNPDSTQILESTRDVLEKLGLANWYGDLRNEYLDGWESGQSDEPEFTPQELERKHLERIYG